MEVRDLCSQTTAHIVALLHATAERESKRLDSRLRNRLRYSGAGRFGDRPGTGLGGPARGRRLLDRATNSAMRAMVVAVDGVPACASSEAGLADSALGKTLMISPGGFEAVSTAGAIIAHKYIVEWTASPCRRRSKRSRRASSNRLLKSGAKSLHEAAQAGREAVLGATPARIHAAGAPCSRPSLPRLSEREVRAQARG